MLKVMRNAMRNVRRYDDLSITLFWYLYVPLLNPHSLGRQLSSASTKHFPNTCLSIATLQQYAQLGKATRDPVDTVTLPDGAVTGTSCLSLVLGKYASEMVLEVGTGRKTTSAGKHRVKLKCGTEASRIEKSMCDVMKFIVPCHNPTAKPART
jgi:hypothetical protein